MSGLVELDVLIGENFFFDFLNCLQFFLNSSRLELGDFCADEAPNNALASLFSLSRLLTLLPVEFNLTI